jgi:hypothetical protein
LNLNKENKLNETVNIYNLLSYYYPRYLINLIKVLAEEIPVASRVLNKILPKKLSSFKLISQLFS